MGHYFGKRLLDFLISAIVLILISPFMLAMLIIIWAQDRHNPLYLGPRVGMNAKFFRIVKLRSMRINADKSGVSSTSRGDNRITPVGHFIRRFKLDELSQLWNVMAGDMSLVGPRPQIASDVEFYSDEEKILLLARPGITDLSSIVFADEGDILADSANADLDYALLIRPWKIKLGLLYIENCSFFLDVRLCVITVIAIFHHRSALRQINHILKNLGSDEKLIEVAKRDKALVPQPLPPTLAKHHGIT